MGAAEELQTTNTEIGSIETLLVSPIQHQTKPATVLHEKLQNFILEHKSVNKQEEFLQLLFQFLAVLKTSVFQLATPS